MTGVRSDLFKVKYLQWLRGKPLLPAAPCPLAKFLFAVQRPLIHLVTHGAMPLLSSDRKNGKPVCAAEIMSVRDKY